VPPSEEIMSKMLQPEDLGRTIARGEPASPCLLQRDPNQPRGESYLPGYLVERRFGFVGISVKSFVGWPLPLNMICKSLSWFFFLVGVPSWSGFTLDVWTMNRRCH
jgi:hypothetical protein